MTTEYVYGIEWRGDGHTEKVIEWYGSESDAITDFNDRSDRESPSRLVRARLSNLEVLHGGSPPGPEGYDDFCYERPRGDKMTTVDDAVEAAARALANQLGFSNPQFEHRWYSKWSVKAAWPVLSAGLRRLHEASTAADYAGDCLCGLRYPCPSARELERSDKERGL